MNEFMNDEESEDEKEEEENKSKEKEEENDEEQKKEAKKDAQKKKEEKEAHEKILDDMQATPNPVKVKVLKVKQLEFSGKNFNDELLLVLKKIPKDELDAVLESSFILAFFQYNWEKY